MPNESLREEWSNFLRDYFEDMNELKYVTESLLAATKKWLPKKMVHKCANVWVPCDCDGWNDYRNKVIGILDAK